MALLHRIIQEPRLLPSCFSTISLGPPLCTAQAALQPHPCSGSQAGDSKYRLGGASQAKAHLTSPRMPLEDSVTWISLTAKEAGKCSAAGQPPARYLSITVDEGA